MSLFAQYKAYFIAAAAVVLIALGWTAAWKIQGGRLDSAKADLKICADANVKSRAAVNDLQFEVRGMNALCANRLAGRDSELKRLRDLDALKGAANETVNAGSGDPLLAELNGMYNGSGH